MKKNISIYFSSSEKFNYTEKKKILDKILITDDEYNKIRAVIDKGALFMDNDKLDEFSNEFLFFLGHAYTYLYYQRLSRLFNKCHRVVWYYLFKKNKYPELLNLYKHSSFVWRIYGELELDEKYLKSLSGKQGFDIGEIENTVENSFNINYYKRRLNEL